MLPSTTSLKKPYIGLATQALPHKAALAVPGSPAPALNICPRIPLPRRVPNRTYTEGVKRTV